jgi:hypothetical protein
MFINVYLYVYVTPENYNRIKLLFITVPLNNIYL